MFHMPTGKKIPTIESKALSIAIKRSMAVRDMKTKELASASGVPYGTLRRILELNTVADYEQLRKIASALRMQLSTIIADAESLASDPEVAEDYRSSSIVDRGVSLDDIAADEQSAIEETLRAYRDNPVDLAASHSSHKHEPDPEPGA